MTEAERARCATAARLLQANQPVAMWGLALSLIALASLLGLVRLGHPASPVAGMGLGSVVLAGALERYLAFRIVFDAGLFTDLARGTLSSLALLDNTLADAGLRRTAGPVRPLDDRLRGARRLLRWHGLLVVGQSLLLIASIFIR